MAETTTNGGDVRPMMLDVKSIHPSKTNPRKTFDDAAHKELVSSIKTHGLLQPILVRPINGGSKYEIVAGERRYRAAKEAGLPEVHVIVRKLTDMQAREIQIVENLQRKDVHALEEALGYKSLLDLRDGGKALYTIESIAERVGKSVSYVYQRLKLADLSEPFQRQFIEHPMAFTAGHAILVARLTAKDQDRLLKEFWRPDHRGDFPSVRALQQVIYERLMLKLDAAPWKREDPTFATVNAKEINPHAKPAKDPLSSSKSSTYGELPACSVCPFNTCVSAQLFTDIHGPVDSEKKMTRDCRCTNPPCYETKMTIHLSRQQAELSAKHPDLVPVSRSYALDPVQAKRLPGVLPAASYEEVKPNAKNAKPALVVDGNDRGTVIYVAPPAKARSNTPERRERPVAERLKELNDRIAAATRKNVLFEMSKPTAKAASALKGIDAHLALDLAAFAISEGLDTNERKKFFGEAFDKDYSYESIRRTMEKFEKPKLVVALLGGVYGRMALASHWTDGHALLLDAAKHFGVDVKKIETETRKAFAGDLAKLTDKKKATVTNIKNAKPKAKAAKPAKAARSQTSARKRA